MSTERDVRRSRSRCSSRCSRPAIVISPVLIPSRTYAVPTDPTHATFVVRNEDHTLRRMLFVWIFSPATYFAPRSGPIVAHARPRTGCLPPIDRTSTLPATTCPIPTRTSSRSACRPTGPPPPHERSSPGSRSVTKSSRASKPPSGYRPLPPFSRRHHDLFLDRSYPHDSHAGRSRLIQPKPTRRALVRKWFVGSATWFGFTTAHFSSRHPLGNATTLCGAGSL